MILQCFSDGIWHTLEASAGQLCIVTKVVITPHNSECLGSGGGGVEIVLVLYRSSLGTISNRLCWGHYLYIVKLKFHQFGSVKVN